MLTIKGACCLLASHPVRQLMLMTTASASGIGAQCRRNKDAVISRVERRLELWTHHNVSYQEDMQILRYSNFQKYGEAGPAAVVPSPWRATAA